MTVRALRKVAASKVCDACETLCNTLSTSIIEADI